MDQRYWIIFTFWIVYFGLHSGLAATSVKSYIQSISSLNKKEYRIVYTLVSVIPLSIFLIWMGTAKHQYISATTGWLQYLGLILASAAVLLFKKSFENYSLKAFIGMKEESSEQLITSGIQAYIRHPLYAATILLIIGFCMYMPTIENLITSFCIALYIPIGIFFEEKKLIKSYGDDYRIYRKEVPAILPRIFS